MSILPPQLCIFPIEIELLSLWMSENVLWLDATADAAILICPMKIGMQMTSSHGDEVEKLCTVYGNKCIVQKSGHRGKNSEHFCWGEAEQGREANTTFIYFKDLGIVWWSRKTWEMGDLHRREDEKIPMRIREAKRSLRASNSTWKELEMP